MRAALAAAELAVHGRAFEHTHGAGRRVELGRVHGDERRGIFDVRQQAQADGAAVAQEGAAGAPRRCEGIDHERAGCVVAEQAVAQAENENARITPVHAPSPCRA